MVFPGEGKELIFRTADSWNAKATWLTFLFDKVLTLQGGTNMVTRLTAVMSELYRYVKTC